MERKTGVAVPLGALYTKESPSVGEYTSLKPFADFCKKCGLGVIQLLPVNDTGFESSPYSGLSAFALHPLYINISALPEFEQAYATDKAFAGAYRTFVKENRFHNRFDYAKILSEKIRLLHLLYAWIEKQIASESRSTLKQSNPKIKEVTVVNTSSFVQQLMAQTDKFIRENKWVISYAVYKNLKDIAMQASWKEWPENLRHLSREQVMLRWNNKALKSSHTFFVWVQMRAAEQFKDAAKYVESQNIILKGDIPILMNEDSADTWANPEFFIHELRAGSPPDGENKCGQNWGFPIYNWDRLEADNYSWWKERIANASQFYKAFRIDHVLGFFRIWAASENDTTAYSGHVEPYKTISLKELLASGFTEERICWLSKPHIPTSLIQNITCNYEEAHRILSLVAERIGNEELWLFKKEIKGDRQFYSYSFCENDAEKDTRIKEALCSKWRDKTLLELTKNHYAFTWCYGETTAWNSLNETEKLILLAFKETLDASQERAWKKQGNTLLRALTASSDMTACAEDLGAVPGVVPDVLKKLGILSLRVIRWTRDWANVKSPFIRFEDYPELCVMTSSVHDSSTLRQWWTNEKESVSSFLQLWDTDDENPLFDNTAPFNGSEEFSPEVAKFCLESAAFTQASWYIIPLQDLLFLDKNYYLEDMDFERINIPGTVNGFNWTYRMPVMLDKLSENNKIISNITHIANIHDNWKAPEKKNETDIQ